MNRQPSSLRATTALRAGSVLAATLAATLLSGNAYAAHGRAPVSRAFARPAQLPAGVDRPSREVLLSVGQGELITLPAAVANVWTSNPEAADVYVSNPRQIHLFGKGFGEATVYATTAAGAVVYSANVRVSQNFSSIDQLMRKAMPDADIHVTLVGQMAVLSGTVKSPDDLAVADSLAKSLLNPGAKPGDTGLKVMVINRLKMATPLQVNLQVRFAEVSRSLVRTLGVNLTSISKGGNGVQFGIGQGRSIGRPYNPGTPLSVDGAVSYTGIDPVTGLPALRAGTTVGSIGGGASTLALAGRFLGLDLLGALDAGETTGLVTTLANPNLTAISGETADFLAGGEFPIPLSQGLGSTTVEYKKFGVSLSYTPTVLANGRISIRVRPEVSELSSSGAVTLGGFTIPALTVRRAETTVELGSGQSFMIAGLMSNHAQNTVQKLPGAGDVPILGALFRSTNFQRGETELVIVVTPYLVNPVDANDIKLPTDGYQNPNDIQRVLGNQESDGKSGAIRPHATSAPDGGLAPKISALDQPIEHTQASADAGSKHKTAASDPAPGFSLN